MYASKDGKNPGLVVKTLNLQHTCGRAFKNPRAQQRWLAKQFKEKVQRSPKYSTTEMRNDLKAEFKLSLSRYKCKCAKREILQEMHGSHKDEYNKLQAYINEIITSDPGTDVCLQVSQEALDKDGTRVFSRMYICFNATKVIL